MTIGCCSSTSTSAEPCERVAQAYPLLKESAGAIVNVASVASQMGTPKRASYCAAKAGIDGLTRSLAVEWAPHGIRGPMRLHPVTSGRR